MKEFVVTVNEKGFIVKVTDEGMLKAYAECMQELIRCKDCKHGRLYDKNCVECEFIKFPTPDKEWFCAYGERRE